LVISFRSHHHAYDPKDPNVTFIDRSVPLTAPRRLLQFIFSLTIVHYFLWIIPMVGLLYIFYSLGLWYISALLFALYLPGFVDNSQFKSGRPWPALRQCSLWRLTSRYIGVEVVRTRVLDPSKRYMFAFYPHGILILSRISVYGGVWEMLFPGIETRVLGASPMFYWPGAREICLWMGAVDAAKKVAVRIYSKFNLNLMVYPGGSDEIFETQPDSNITTLIVRKGFIKLAVQNGAEIVPAFVFGEKWLYGVKELPKIIKSFFMKQLRTPLILFWGRYFTWLPFHDNKQKFLSVVYGAPIPIIQQDEPSDEYINEIWEQYATQIHSIFNTYKGKYGYADNETLVLKEARSSNNNRKNKLDGDANKTNGRSKKEE
jgi:hypothetical protein